MKEGLDGSSVCLNPSTATASLFFFFNDPAPPEISPLPPHDALPIPTIERPSPSSASSSTTSVRRTDAPFTRYCPSPPRCSRRAIASVEKSSPPTPSAGSTRSEEHTSELQSRSDLVCRLLLEKKKPPYDLARGSHQEASLSGPRYLARILFLDQLGLVRATDGIVAVGSLGVRSLRLASVLIVD